MFLCGLVVFAVLGLVFPSDVLAQEPAIDIENDYGLPAVVVVLSVLEDGEKLMGLYALLRLPSPFPSLVPFD